MNTCKNCNEPVNENHGSNHGQPTEIEKINRRYILNEIADVLFVNSGMFYTIKSLLTNPGTSIRRYITEDRSRLIRPISFIVVTSLIYTIISYFFPLDVENYVTSYGDISNGQKEMNRTILAITKWTQENTGYTNLLIGFFMAFGVKVCFRKAGYNLSEIYVLLCYVFGLTTLIDTASLIFQAATHLNLMNFLLVIDMVYITWATGQFFNEKKAASYIKALLSFILGFIILTFLMTLPIVIFIHS
ncbi:DUF3667 domain-containing protein [Bacteroides sp. UBA939]|uniref:DUF3667 domain-containing protein n=1 Tax=Bacteroides sp. UBA939 TaxID=1946092 RepID=UPI0025C25F2A|nr:DUF3667 domain-containing protein [Bacteroides sp. UBA939]